MKDLMLRTQAVERDLGERQGCVFAPMSAPIFTSTCSPPFPSSTPQPPTFRDGTDPLLGAHAVIGISPGSAS
jgi:hypothetical protein